MSEKTDEKRKKLIYRSWHRGTREMDLLLGSFADKYVPVFTPEQLEIYEDLLKENDPDLYNWYSGREAPPDRLKSSVFESFLKHRFTP